MDWRSRSSSARAAAALAHAWEDRPRGGERAEHVDLEHAPDFLGAGHADAALLGRRG
jgi:hypothetical protein